LNGRRSELGADLVTVIRPFYAAAQGNSCGVSYVSGYQGSSIALSVDYALSVVSDGVDHAGARYYCDDLSLAHELGHNMGLMHDRATVATQGGGYGATPYAFGYAVPSRWGTIMSYTYPHQVKFSNPLDYTCNGAERCGLPASDANSADNVRALGQTMPAVAAFRADSGQPAPFTVMGVASLNGWAAAGVTVDISNIVGADPNQVACQPSANNGAYSCSAPAGYGFTLTPNYPWLPTGVTLSWLPASATFTNLDGNKSQNFSGTLILPDGSVPTRPHRRRR